MAALILNRTARSVLAQAVSLGRDVPDSLNSKLPNY